LAEIGIPENSPGQCAAVPGSTWTSHNPTMTANLALVSWYSGGLQVIGLDDPAHPQRLAELRPSGVHPTLRDLQLGTSDAMTWSYPVINQGLVYVVDINQGLLVLRYAGPRQDEIGGLAFAEGNSNLVAAGAAAASPTPAPSPTYTASPTPARTPSAGPASSRLVAVAGAAVLALVALGLVVLARRRS
jgi:hypothetical protein